LVHAKGAQFWGKNEGGFFTRAATLKKFLTRGEFVNRRKKQTQRGKDERGKGGKLKRKREVVKRSLRKTRKMAEVCAKGGSHIQKKDKVLWLMRGGEGKHSCNEGRGVSLEN